MANKYKFILFLFLLSTSGYTQTNSHWRGEQGSFILNYNKPVTYKNNSVKGYGLQATIAQNNGTLVLQAQPNIGAYYFKDSICISANNPLLHTRNCINYFCKTGDQEYMAIHHSYGDSDSTNGLYSCKISIEADSIKKYQLNQNLLQPEFFKSSLDTLFSESCTRIMHYRLYSYILFTIINDSLLIYLIDSNGIKFKSAYNLQTLIPFKNCEGGDLTNKIYSIAVCNNLENIFVYSYYAFRKEYSYLNIRTKMYCCKYDLLHKFHFNANTFRISDPIYTEILYHWEDNPLDTLFTYYQVYTDQMTLSDNDSFLYFFSNSAIYKRKIPVLPIVESNDILDTVVYKLVQFNTTRATIKEVGLISPPDICVKLKEGIAGELWFISAKNRKTISFDRIVNPNADNAYLKENEFVFNTGNDVFWGQFNHVRDQFRIDYEIDYTCRAEVKFTDYSNPYIPFDSFVWAIHYPTHTDTQYTRFPRLIFTLNGDYFIKGIAVAKSLNNYSEIYTDTIYIRIPQKPIAAFTATQTKVCRFSPVVFKNNSYSAQSHPAVPSKYTWYFGDGDSLVSSTATAVTHVYKLPGNYTVSLHYYNGYCDSLLVKEQYITVADAPVPGFSVSDSIGCAPQAIAISDTATVGITQKQYYFSDLDSWLTVQTLPLIHEFTTAGKHKIVQRLVGYTGCITQTDSVWINLSEGLSNRDTLHMSVATFTPTDSIALYWPPLKGAVGYRVYGSSNGSNFTYLQSVRQNTATITYTSGQPSFVARGVDSCGRTSASGLMGKPVILQGTASNNSTATLSYSPYAQWADNRISYTIEKQLNGQWEPIGTQQSTATYTDGGFAIKGQSQSCYRIRAQNSQYYSYSNTLCLPYVPVIYLPNAISPNADNLNETLQPVTYGIEQWEICIYTRWGQKVLQYNQGQTPTMSSLTPGVYMMRCIATDNQHNQHVLNQTLHVVE